MNIIEEIINETNVANVTLYIKDSQLAFVAEQGAFPSELKAKIKKHKEDIIRVLLAAQGSTSHTDTTPFSMLTEEERDWALRQGYEDAYPMSALQAGMVFHTQLEEFS